MLSALPDSLPNWLNLLENRLTAPIQMGLSRIKAVAQRLDLLSPNALVITVAGTNGKGSTVSTLEAIYHEAGYCVGSYSSPHLMHFNERIRLNRQNITDDHLCEAFKVIEQGRMEVTLTYFEMATLAALWYFKQSQVDLIILEVGMGGRLDATNCINPALTIITTVDLDHQEYLGKTKEAIAFEKTGILRPRIPLIYADTNPPFPIIDRARLLGCPYFIQGSHYTIHTLEKTLTFKHELLMTLPLPNVHPNAVGAALMTCSLLEEKMPVSSETIKNALQSLLVPARVQVFEGQVTTIIDVAHNPQAVLYLSTFLKKYLINYSHDEPPIVRAVFSALKDKNIREMVEIMKPYVNEWYPSLLFGPRAPTEEDIRYALNSHANIAIFKDPMAAYCAAFEHSAVNDIIIVFGSFLTASAVLPLLEKKPQCKEKMNEAIDR